MRKSPITEPSPDFSFNKSSDWKNEDTRINCAVDFLKKAIKEWDNNKTEDALKHLGYALHCVQDISAHGNVGVGGKISSHVLKSGFDDFEYDWADSERKKVTKSNKYERKNEALTFTLIIVILFALETNSNNYYCNKCSKK